MKSLLFTLIAALILLAVVAPPAHADKCTGTKLKAVGKKEAGLLACQAKVAKTGDSSGLSACEMKVMDKFAAAFTKAGACAGDQTTCENMADGCESTVSSAMTDTFPSKCESAKRKAAGKLSSGELGCYSNAAAKGLPLDTSCITKAQSKFGAAFTKAGTCPDGGSPQSEVENNCVKPTVATDGGGVVTDVCPTTTTTSTTTTTTTTSTTTTTIAPTCANGGIPCGGPCGLIGNACAGSCSLGRTPDPNCLVTACNPPTAAPSVCWMENPGATVCDNTHACPPGEVCIAPALVPLACTNAQGACQFLCAETTTTSTSTTTTTIPTGACGTFLTTWGSAGSGDGQFSLPVGVAVDGSGNVFVSEQNNHRIQKFDNNGTFVTTWGSAGTGNGQFNVPRNVAVDGTGNVFVADAFNNRVQKFTNSGTFITTWGSLGSGSGQFNQPVGVGVDGSGNVFVADSLNNRVQKFTNSGTFVTMWGSPGNGAGQFTHPSGVAADGSGNVFVVDNGNDRIQKFTNTGTFMTMWGSGGSGTGQFGTPFDVAVDGSGNVFISEETNNRIQKFDNNGTFITMWGSAGSGDGQFNNPVGVGVDGSGHVFVADLSNNRIQKFACP